MYENFLEIHDSHLGIEMKIEIDWVDVLGGTLIFVTVLTLILLTLDKQTPTQETSITCTTNDSQIHEVQGWKKIETVDYHRIGAQVSQGKAQVECKPATLMCTAFIDGKAYPETKGCAWYWRKV